VSVKVSLLVAAGLSLILLLLRFFILVDESKQDKPGPHNNWRQNRKVSSDMSEDSGFAQDSGGIHYGGGSD
jgi:hypothetical protein